MLFDELRELAGQRNAIDGRIVEIVAEMDRDGLWAPRVRGQSRRWWPGSWACHSANAGTITAVAHRLAEFPRCAQGMREGQLSLDQVGVIAERAGEGSDEHYAELASVAWSVSCVPRSSCEPRPEPESAAEHRSASITKTSDEHARCWRIRLPDVEAANFDAALGSHQEALIAEWKHDHDEDGEHGISAPPLPNTTDAFMRLVETGWDAEDG